MGENYCPKVDYSYAACKVIGEKAVGLAIGKCKKADNGKRLWIYVVKNDPMKVFMILDVMSMITNTSIWISHFMLRIKVIFQAVKCVVKYR